MFYLGFLYIFYIIYFYIFTFSFFTVFFACNSAFEQGHLEPWRYINAFIIIIINYRCGINCIHTYTLKMVKLNQPTEKASVGAY